MGELNQLWSERYTTSEESMSEDERSFLVLKRNVYLILNRLTPTNFTHLVQEFLSLDISSLTTMELVVSLVHEKAIKEPLYSHSYARLAQFLSQEAKKANMGAQKDDFVPKILKWELKLPNISYVDDEGVTAVTCFRTVLLQKCQREFEKSLLRYNLPSSRVLLESAQQRLWDEIMYYRHLQQRLRKIGNIIFIGNLCKAKVIAANIVHNCIMQLLDSNRVEPNEDTLECLCKLLANVGEELDQTDFKMQLDCYFQKISDFLLNYQLSSRVRFALQDLIDLRNGDWVPRLPREYPRPMNEFQLGTG